MLINLKLKSFSYFIQDTRLLTYHLRRNNSCNFYVLPFTRRALIQQIWSFMWWNMYQTMRAPEDTRHSAILKCKEKEPRFGAELDRRWLGPRVLSLGIRVQTFSKKTGDTKYQENSLEQKTIMRHHCPIKYCIPNQFFNRNNKAFNIKVHTAINRCRFIVTHWNKCVTLKLFSQKCNSWWWYFNKSQWRWLLQCIEFSQGSWFSAKQPSISASPRQCFERGQEPDAVWLCLSFPCEKKSVLSTCFRTALQ